MLKGRIKNMCICICSLLDWTIILSHMDSGLILKLREKVHPFRSAETGTIYLNLEF